MPFYDYRCECGAEFEVFQRMSDEPMKFCTGREDGCKLVDGARGRVERVLGATHGKVVGGTPRHHQRAPRK